MKHFHLKPLDNVLSRILDKDLDSCRTQGGFMKSEGPIFMPISLGRPEANAIEGLMSKGENFTFWFTPDYRVALTTKSGNEWKLKFECRGIKKDGRATAQVARVEGTLSVARVIDAIAHVFQRTAQEIGAKSAAAKTSESVEPSEAVETAP